jgi:hypothetical protein
MMATTNRPRKRLVLMSLRLTQEEIDVMERIATYEIEANPDRDRNSEAVGALLVWTWAPGRMPWEPRR